MYAYFWFASWLIIHFVSMSMIPELLTLAKMKQELVCKQAT